jgi:hypothetical protein
MAPIESELVRRAAGLDPMVLARFVARTHDVDPASVQLEIRSLRGSLEVIDVARVMARFTVRPAKPRFATFVVKRLEGNGRREADLYRTLLEPAATFAPRMLGVDVVGPSTSYLYLEYVRAARAWPWRNVVATGAVLAQLGALHAPEVRMTSRARRPPITGIARSSKTTSGCQVSTLETPSAPSDAVSIE